MSIDAFLERVAERYDPDELVDLLGLTTAQLVAAFEDELLAARKRGLLPEIDDD